MFSSTVLQRSMASDTETKILRGDSKILIEGKWANIRGLVQDLLDDGWKYTAEPTGEPSGFKFTELHLERRFTGSDMNECITQ